MKKMLIFLQRGILLFLFVLFFSPLSAYAWGAYTHHYLNRRAVESVPGDLGTFYQKNKKFIEEHAVDADIRRRKDRKKEAPRHFMDIEDYDKTPFKKISKMDYRKARKVYGMKKLRRGGTAPWAIAYMTQRLRKAFKNQNLADILQLSADIGHYVADVHEPLHCTNNYNGQLTGNKGIHSKYETKMMYRYLDELTIPADTAVKISDIRKKAFQWVIDANRYVPLIMRADRKAFFDVAVYDDYYYEKLWKGTKDLTKAQLRAAIRDIASVWYTAWKQADSPKLP